jgi:hypothetical protein
VCAESSALFLPWSRGGEEGKRAGAAHLGVGFKSQQITPHLTKTIEERFSTPHNQILDILKYAQKR